MIIGYMKGGDFGTVWSDGRDSMIANWSFLDEFTLRCSDPWDVEIGDYAAQYLIEVSPDTVECYVVLPNMYAEADHWEKFSRVKRNDGKERCHKDPGCSNRQRTYRQIRSKTPKSWVILLDKVILI